MNTTVNMYAIHIPTQGATSNIVLESSDDTAYGKFKALIRDMVENHNDEEYAKLITLKRIGTIDLHLPVLKGLEEAELVADGLDVVQTIKRENEAKELKREGVNENE